MCKQIQKVNPQGPVSLLVMALEEELPRCYQASLSRVEVPEVSGHG